MASARILNRAPFPLSAILHERGESHATEGLAIEHLTPIYDGWIPLWADHAVLQITLPNRQVFYLDNFVYGGSDDHIFFELPSELIVPGAPEHEANQQELSAFYEAVTNLP